MAHLKPYRSTGHCTAILFRIETHREFRCTYSEQWSTLQSCFVITHLCFHFSVLWQTMFPLLKWQDSSLRHLVRGIITNKHDDKMEHFFHVQNITSIIQLNVTCRLSRMDHREYWECCMYLWATSSSTPLLKIFRNVTENIRDFRLPPRGKRVRHSSEMLRGLRWYLFTDVSGQHMVPIFLECLTLEDWTDRLSRNVGREFLTCAA